MVNNKQKKKKKILNFFQQNKVRDFDFQHSLQPNDIYAKIEGCIYFFFSVNKV